MTHGYFQTVEGADDTSAGGATELNWELDEDFGRCYVSFPEPSWDDRGSRISGLSSFHLDLTVVGLCVYFG